MAKILLYCYIILVLSLTFRRSCAVGVLSPLIRTASEIAGNAVASSVETVADSALPLVVARALAALGTTPLVSDTNLVDLTNRIVGDYNIGSKNEDAHLNVTSLLLKYGKSVEEHTVHTADGYELSLFRIPSDGPPVFLMHGLVGSADDYVLMGPKISLAYFLSDNGYDVWLGNARGNKYSRKHAQLDPSDAAFWNFSWHEIGIYDLPAMIDYALQESGSEQIGYVGHSQGTTSFFVMGSELVEYNKKISIMIALSPVAYMSHVRSPVVRLASLHGPALHAVTRMFGVHEFLPQNTLIRILGRAMCGFGQLSDILCTNIIFLGVGFGLEHLDTKSLPVVLGHFPSGAATKQLVHYGQGVVSGEFRQFDYGVAGNMARYGQSEPPGYQLARLTAPVSLFYSDQDWLSHPTDVDRLYNELPNAVDIHKLPRFNHLDYIIANDANNMTTRLIRLIKHFQKTR